VERCFGTLQNRLVKALRRAQVTTLAQANQYLQQRFLPEWQTRFTVAAASSVDAHRPLGALPLASILSFAEPRRVANDFTIAWEGRRWQIPRPQLRVGLRGSSIRVEQRLDGTMMASIDGIHGTLQPCEPCPTPQREKLQRPVRRFVPPAGHSRWMQRFSVRRDAQPQPSHSAQLRSPSGFPPPG